MGILSQAIRGAGWAPDDDRWYNPGGSYYGGDQASATGAVVTTDSAMRCSAVMACVRIISETVASLPLQIFERLPNGGKQVAAGHPLYNVLHDAPNSYQTAFEWREQMMVHLLLRGNAYSRIVSGRRGFADQLIPMNPVCMKPVMVNSRLLYEYRVKPGVTETLTDDEVFHIRGMSLDGINGLSPIAYARESVGLSLATEEYGARLFSNGTNVGMILTHPGELKQVGKQALREDLEQFYTGLRHAHKTLILSENIKADKIGMTSEDAQFLETRRYQIAEIARIYRVPLVLLQETDKATSWGSGIDSFMTGFVTYTIRPWLVRWEQDIKRDLILAPKYFAEHKIDGLLRGDAATRGEFYYKALLGKWMTPNEIRNLENMNPMEGGDAPIELNAGGAKGKPAESPDESSPDDTQEEED